MNVTSSVLLDAIAALAAELPLQVTMQVAAALRRTPPSAWLALRGNAQQAAGTPHARNQVGQVLTTWQHNAPFTAPESVALALEAAAMMVTQLP